MRTAEEAYVYRIKTRPLIPPNRIIVDCSFDVLLAFYYGMNIGQHCMGDVWKHDRLSSTSCQHETMSPLRSPYCLAMLFMENHHR